MFYVRDPQTCYPVHMASGTGFPCPLGISAKASFQAQILPFVCVLAEAVPVCPTLPFVLRVQQLVLSRASPLGQARSLRNADFGVRHHWAGTPALPFVSWWPWAGGMYSVFHLESGLTLPW